MPVLTVPSISRHPPGSDDGAALHFSDVQAREGHRTGFPVRQKGHMAVIHLSVECVLSPAMVPEIEFHLASKIRSPSFQDSQRAWKNALVLLHPALPDRVSLDQVVRAVRSAGNGLERDNQGFSFLTPLGRLYLESVP